MKKLSVQLKINIWYTGILIIVMLLVLVFVVVVSDRAVYSEAEAELIEAVEEFADEIEFESGRYELEDDLDYYEDGVSFSVYDKEGHQIAGIIPVRFPENLTLKTNENQRTEAEGKRWMVHDIALQYGEKEIVWVRGVVSLNSSQWIMRSVWLAVLIICPLVVAAGSAGGYFVTKRALRPVEESYEREKQFTADASHELRTPVSAIIAQSEYGLDTDDEQERREALEAVLRQAKRMSGLIGQLLQLSRMTSGKDEIHFEKIDLKTLIEVVSEELEEKAEQHGIRLTFSCPEPVFVKGDQELLMRLFLNLIENGITYGRKGGYVEIKAREEKNRICCTVSDNGIGISQEDLPKIWDRFYRADISRSSGKESNSGLGLAMVKWIVQVHGGEINVRSSLGEGSAFTVYL